MMNDFASVSDVMNKKRIKREIMKIQVDENNEILLTEVYSGVGLKTRDGEFLGVCMRDTGFEFNYNGTWYEAKKGVIQKIGADASDSDDNDTCCNGG